MTKRVEEEPQVKGPPGQKKQEEQIVNWNKALNVVRTTMQYIIEVNKKTAVRKEGVCNRDGVCIWKSTSWPSDKEASNSCKKKIRLSV